MNFKLPVLGILFYFLLLKTAHAQSKRYTLYQKDGISIYYEVERNTLNCISGEGQPVYEYTYYFYIGSASPLSTFINGLTISARSGQAWYWPQTKTHCGSTASSFTVYGPNRIEPEETTPMATKTLRSLSNVHPMPSLGILRITQSPTLSDKINARNAQLEEEQARGQERRNQPTSQKKESSQAKQPANRVEDFRKSENQRQNEANRQQSDQQQRNLEHRQQLEILREQSKIRREESLTTIQIHADAGIELYLNGESEGKKLEEPPYHFSAKVVAGDVRVKIVLLATGATYLDKVYSDLAPLRVKAIEVKAADQLGIKEKNRLSGYNQRKTEILRKEHEAFQKEQKRRDFIMGNLASCMKYLYHNSRDKRLEQDLIYYANYVNIKDDNQEYPLRKAIRNNDIIAVKALNKLGAHSKQYQDDYIRLSLELETPGLAGFLLDSLKLTTNLFCEDYLLPRNYNMFEFLNRMGLDYKCMQNSDNNNLLHHAASSGDIKWCSFLIQNGFKINDLAQLGFGTEVAGAVEGWQDEKQTVLFYAAYGRNFEMVKFLLEKGAKSTGKYGISAGIKIREKKLSEYLQFSAPDTDKAIINLLKEYKQ